MTVVKQNGAMCEIIGTTNEQPPMNVGKDSLLYMLDTKQMLYFNGEEWYPIGEGDNLNGVPNNIGNITNIS